MEIIISDALLRSILICSPSVARYTRRTFAHPLAETTMRLVFCTLSLLGLAVTPALTLAAEPARHNVLFLVADDLGMEVGCYGNKVIKTPNIDALAKNGTRFTHGFATVSSCSPSRACLYSGLFSHTNGMYGLAHAEHHFRSQENIKSLPRVLKDAGYRCGILGKNH